MNDFVGQGWAFPLTVSPRGGIALASGGDELDGSLRMILSTAPGERVMRPDFGCALWEQLFAPLNATTIGLIEQAVREAVGRWEPRVEIGDVTATPHEPGSLLHIAVAYRVKATNDRRNLVYPFYLIPAEEP